MTKLMKSRSLTQAIFAGSKLRSTQYFHPEKEIRLMRPNFQKCRFWMPFCKYALDYLLILILKKVSRNEAMRLLPPVPSSIQRATSLELKTGSRIIGSKLVFAYLTSVLHIYTYCKLWYYKNFSYIPDNTAIYTPPYCFHRDPRNYSPLTDTFYPDRWLPGFSGITNISAFIPFSIGPQVCAGKSLALVEMRMVEALLVQRFNMVLEPSYDPSRWESDMEDWLVATKGRLPVIMTQRQWLNA